MRQIFRIPPVFNTPVEYVNVEILLSPRRLGKQE